MSLTQVATTVAVRPALVLTNRENTKAGQANVVKIYHDKTGREIRVSVYEAFTAAAN